MGTENKFIAKEDKSSKENSKTGKSKNKSKGATSKVSPIALIKDRFDKKKLKSSIGVGLILLATLLFLANFSYLFTWKADQSRILSKGFFEFLFDGSSEPVENWMGKFGAWTSHLLIHRWFGLTSFAIPFAMIVVGFKALFNISILPVKKTLLASFFTLIWGSLFFGIFSSQVNYLGGSFGFQSNEWLNLAIGKIGTIIFIFALGYLLSAVLLNVKLKKIADWLGLSKTDLDENLS